jgi:hypothetical protein
LGGRFFRFFTIFSKVNFHFTELMVGQEYNTNLPIIWKASFDVYSMSLACLLANTESSVHGILKHAEAVIQKQFTETRVRSPFRLADYGQIKHGH